MISILDSGADRTGVNDSTAAIQAALDSSDPVVEFPPGRYRIGSVTDGPSSTYHHCIRVPSGKQLVGDRAVLQVDDDIDGTKDTIRTMLVYAAAFETVTNVLISGIEIRANASGQSGNTRVSAIYIAEDGGTVEDITVQNCIFRDCQHGVFARGNRIYTNKLQCYAAFDPIGGIAKGFSFQAPAKNEETYYYGEDLYVNGADGAGINWTGIESSRKGNAFFKNLVVKNAFQVKTQGPWRLDVNGMTIKNSTDKGLKLADARSTLIRNLTIIDSANESLELDPVEDSHIIEGLKIQANSDNQPAVKINGTSVIRNWKIIHTSNQRSILAQGAHVSANRITIDGGTLNYPLNTSSPGSVWSNVTIKNATVPNDVLVNAPNQTFYNLVTDNGLFDNSTGTLVNV